MIDRHSLVRFALLVGASAAALAAAFFYPAPLPLHAQSHDPNLAPVNTAAATPEPVDWLQAYNSMNQSYMTLWQAPAVRFEEAVLAQGDAAVVSWADAQYALPAYLLRYQQTGDQTHLAHFMARTRQLLQYRRDLDGDGLKGWTTARYGADLIRNGNFSLNTDEWEGIAGDDLVRLAERTEVLAWPLSNSACRAYLPGINLGRRYATLKEGAILRQTVNVPTANLYRLAVASQPGANALLDITLASATGATARFQITPSPQRGPEGWQSDGFDLVLQPGATYTISVQATRTDPGVPIAIDNLALTVYEEEFTADFHMASAMVRFALLVRQARLGEPYTSAAQEYVAIAKEIVQKWQKNWRQLDSEHSVYIDNNNPPFNLPYNKLAAAGETLLELSRYLAGDEAAAFQSQALMLGRTFQQALRPGARTPGGLVWNYRDRLIPESPAILVQLEDLSHAGHIVPFIRLLYESGLLFSAGDLDKIEASLLGAWDQNADPPEYWLLLDGESTFLRAYQLPYIRHIELTYSPELQHATTVSWQTRTTIRCQQETATIVTGRLIYIPAAMLALLESPVAPPVKIYLPFLPNG